MRRDHLPGQLGMFSTAETLKPAKLAGGWPKLPAGDLVLQHPPDGKQHAPPAARRLHDDQPRPLLARLIEVRKATAQALPGDCAKLWDSLSVDDRGALVRDFHHHPRYAELAWCFVESGLRDDLAEAYYKLTHGLPVPDGRAGPNPEQQRPTPPVVVVDEATYYQAQGTYFSGTPKLRAVWTYEDALWLCTGYTSYGWNHDPEDWVEEAHMAELVPVKDWRGPLISDKDWHRGKHARPWCSYEGRLVTHDGSTYVIGERELTLQWRRPLREGEKTAREKQNAWHDGRAGHDWPEVGEWWDGIAESDRRNILRELVLQLAYARRTWADLTETARDRIASQFYDITRELDAEAEAEEIGPTCDTCIYRAEDDAGESCGLRCQDLPEARTCGDHCPAEEVSDAPQAQA